MLRCQLPAGANQDASLQSTWPGHFIQGFSFQQEFHWKRVIDRSFSSNQGSHQSDLFGGYAQTGYFFNEICDFVPEPLELAFRYALVRSPTRPTASRPTRGRSLRPRPTGSLLGTTTN
jgi:hypothetical protein